jgi:hypothetical protein
MKPLVLFLSLSLAGTTFGSILRLETVTQPLYLHGSETDSRISLQAVPFVTYAADPEWRFAAICAPFIPAGSWRQPHDVNLASLYRIKVDGTYKKDTQDILVTVDASKATQPDGYPFTVEQVIEAVVTCVKIMYPQRPPDEGALEITVTRPAAVK